MPRSSAIAPENTDRDIYLVLEDFGPLGRAWRETGDEQADRRTLIRYLLEGQYEDPIRVVAFNTAQGWSRDVTEEIANELRIRCAESGKTPSKLQAFLDQHRS